MLTLRRNLNGWEWVIVDDEGHHVFMSRSFYAVPSYMHGNDIDAIRVEVEPGEFLWLEHEMAEGWTEQEAKNIVIA